MKQITFNEVVKNYNDNNSVVLCGIIPDCTAEDVENFFRQTKFIPEEKKVVDIMHLSDNVKGDEGRSDILVVLTEEGMCNPMVRLMLSAGGGPAIKWTSDFIDNYACDYLSGE